MKKKFSYGLSMTLALALSMGLAGCGSSSGSSFYGTWEYETMDIWVVFNEDGTYNWYYDDAYEVTGEFTIDDEVLTMTDASLTFSFDDDDGLVDSDGDALFASSLPDFTSAFVGIWEYEDYDLWIVINDDGTCIWYYEDGSSLESTYTMDVSTLTTDELSFNADGSGGLIDSDGDALFASSLDGVNTVSVSDFYGTWEYTDHDYWLVVYSDGTFDWYNNEGYSFSGSYSLSSDGVLVLENTGITITVDGDGLIDNDDDTLFASSLPSSFAITLDDFIGTWEYADKDVYVVFYDDGTYLWYNAESDSTYTYTYTYTNQSIVMDDDDLTFYVDEEYEGWLIDSNGDDLFTSTLPN